MKDSNLEQQIRDKLEEMRGMLQSDGGDMELVEISGKTVKLRLQGACGCCPHATQTIKNGIEQHLRDTVDKGITVERVE